MVGYAIVDRADTTWMCVVVAPVASGNDVLRLQHLSPVQYHLAPKTGRALLREHETQRLNELHGSLFRQASIVVRKKLELVFVLFQDDTNQLTPSAHAGL